MRLSSNQRKHLRSPPAIHNRDLPNSRPFVQEDEAGSLGTIDVFPDLFQVFAPIQASSPR
jgi:hypothetical protein